MTHWQVVQDIWKVIFLGCDQTGSCKRWVEEQLASASLSVSIGTHLLRAALVLGSAPLVVLQGAQDGSVGGLLRWKVFLVLGSSRFKRASEPGEHVLLVGNVASRASLPGSSWHDVSFSWNKNSCRSSSLKTKILPRLNTRPRKKKLFSWQEMAGEQFPGKRLAVAQTTS